MGYLNIGKRDYFKKENILSPSNLDIFTHTFTHTNDDLVTNFYLLTLMWVLESILRRVFKSDNNNLKRLSATFGSCSNSSNLTLVKFCPSHNLFFIYKFQNIQYVNL